MTAESSRARDRERIRRFTVLVLVDRGALVPGEARFKPGLSDHQVELALRRLVQRVELLEFTDARTLLDALDSIQSDVVFNLTQVASGDRCMDGHICALLDLHGVAYTGAGVRGLVLGRDKALSKQVVRDVGFPVPAFFVLSKERRKVPAQPKFPLVVKPRYGDASEGISQQSVVHTPAALTARIKFLRKKDVHDIICEEYIDGRELYIGMVGTEMVRPKEFVIGRAIGGTWLASERFKYDPKFRERHKVSAAYIDLTPEQEQRLRTLTRAAAIVLEVGDYSRIDVRLTPAGEFVFLEANPNPGLAPPNTTWAGTWDPVDYDAMIAQIVHRAYARHR